MSFEKGLPYYNCKLINVLCPYVTSHTRRTRDITDYQIEFCKTVYGTHSEIINESRSKHFR